MQEFLSPNFDVFASMNHSQYFFSGPKSVPGGLFFDRDSQGLLYDAQIFLSGKKRTF